MFKFILTFSISCLLLNAIVLKQTGQTVSYDASGNAYTDNTIRDDGYYQKGEEKSFSRVDENNITNDIVTDHATGLHWEDSNNTDANGVTKNWQDAVTYCDDSTYKGYLDWRLPSLKELESIINYDTQISGPSADINTSAFQFFASSYYWTFTPSTSSYYYSVGFQEGGFNSGDSTSNELSVRCVRGAPFLPNLDLSRYESIVSNHITGLQWQDDNAISSTTDTWENAIDYCEDMTLGGYSNWRLPNARELLSIHDDATNAISAIFQNTASGEYWSSTTRRDVHTQALTHGSIDGKGNLNYIRCVRDGQLNPGIVPIEDQNITSGTAFIYDAVLKEGIKPITWSLNSPPTGMNINPATGHIMWKEAKKGNYTISVQASNSYGNSSLEQFSLIVKDASKPLKKTKQTTSYSNFDDGYYQKGVEPKYSRSNGVVTDTVIGLQWQDNIPSPLKDLQGANNYCAALSLDNKADWRLPNIEELETILYYGLMTDSEGLMNTIDLNAFENAEASGYWSSTPSNKVSATAWSINFSNGNDTLTGSGNSLYVRCVRGEAMNAPNLSRYGTIVTDKRTGLQWEDNASVETITLNWEGAIGYCENLTLEGLDDWRLPNIRELTSIINHKEHMLDTGFQEGLYTTNFWTSTTNPAFTGSAWYLDTNQYNANGDKSNTYHVRCVRAEPKLGSKSAAMPAIIMYLLN